jgi:hypothetical protein
MLTGAEPLNDKAGPSRTADVRDFIPVSHYEKTLSQRKKEIKSRPSGNARRLREQAESCSRDSIPVLLPQRFEEMETLPPFQWLPATQAPESKTPSCPPGNKGHLRDLDEDEPMGQSDVEEDREDLMVDLIDEGREDIDLNSMHGMAVSVEGNDTHQVAQTGEQSPSVIPTSAPPNPSPTLPLHRRLTPNVRRLTSTSGIPVDLHTDSREETLDKLEETHRDDVNELLASTSAHAGAGAPVKAAAELLTESGGPGPILLGKSTSKRYNPVTYQQKRSPMTRRKIQTTPADQEKGETDDEGESNANLPPLATNEAEMEAANEAREEFPNHLLLHAEPLIPVRVTVKRKRSSPTQSRVSTNGGRGRDNRSTSKATAPPARRRGRNSLEPRGGQGREELEEMDSHSQALEVALTPAAGAMGTHSPASKDFDGRVRFRSAKTRAISEKASPPVAISKRFDGFVFCISTIIKSESGGSEVKERLKRAIESHGGVLVDDIFDVYERPVQREDPDEPVWIKIKKYQGYQGIFLLQPGPQSRTAKVLLALALGIPCLSPKYIEDAIEEVMINAAKCNPWADGLTMSRLFQNDKDIWKHYVLSPGHSRFLGATISQVVPTNASATLNNSPPLNIFRGKSFSVMDPKKQGNPDVRQRDPFSFFVVLA